MGNIQKTEKNKLFDNIRVLLAEARKFVVKNINQTMVCTYFEIGRMIVEDEQKGENRAEYGKRVLEELSGRLTKEFGRGFSLRNLEQMRQFYLSYSIPQTLSAELQTPNFQLSWSHYLKLMRIEDIAERQFYEIEAVNNQWSLRELQRQYDSALYQRLALSKDKQGILELSKKGQTIEKPEDAIKDPLIIEFTGLPENSIYSETDLEQKLIDKLEHFMLELGKGFTFVGRQVRFTFDEKHFRVDLVFYNRILQCFVLIDLKIGDLTHQDIGQMQMYVNYYDRFVRLEHENKTIGIILCRDKNETLVKITLPEDNEQIFASRYQTVLPSKEELKKLLDSKE
jgi:predicted nuclease of restriction endonuclease-like (RecB) superfamily